MPENIPVYFAPEGSSNIEPLGSFTNSKAGIRRTEGRRPYLYGIVAVARENDALLDVVRAHLNDGAAVWVVWDDQFVRVESAAPDDCIECSQALPRAAVAKIGGAVLELTVIEPSPPRVDWYEPARQAAIEDYIATHDGELDEEFEAARKLAAAGAK